MWTDPLTALAVIPFGAMAAGFTFMLIEWSKEDNTHEAHLYARLFGKRKKHDSEADIEEEQRYHRMP